MSFNDNGTENIEQQDLNSDGSGDAEANGQADDSSAAG